MSDAYTPKVFTKMRALDRMKSRVRAGSADPNESRHRDYMQAMLAARTAYEKHNVSIRMVATILEEMLICSRGNE